MYLEATQKPKNKLEAEFWYTTTTATFETPYSALQQQPQKRKQNLENLMENKRIFRAAAKAQFKNAQKAS